jgi:hypothetical protein
VKSLPTKPTIRKLEGLGALTTARLHAEARRLSPEDATALRRLAGQVAEDFDRLAADLRKGKGLEASE